MPFLVEGTDLKSVAYVH